MCIEPPTPKDELSLEPITSPPRKKSKITFGLFANDSKEDEWTCSDEIRGRAGEELDAIAMWGNIEEESEPNIDQVINNIQVEPIVFIKPVVSITKFVTIAIESF